MTAADPMAVHGMYGTGYGPIYRGGDWIFNHDRLADPKMGVCPHVECRKPSFYVGTEDQFFHADGSDNAGCWAALTRGGRDAYADPLPYKATNLADVEPERVQWLWPRWLPAGKLVTLDGDPGAGKSTLCIDITARLTTGRPMPGEDEATVPTSDVILMSAEDGLADTIRPRLEAAGAHEERVHHFDSVQRRDEEGNVRWVPPTIPDDLGALLALIVNTGAVLVVIDVLMAYLSGRADAHRDQDVRRALHQLAYIADRTGACVILLRHLRKSRGSAIYAGGGSIGIVGAARLGMVAAADPNDETGRRHVLAVAKSNLGPIPDSLGYQLATDPLHDVGAIEWTGTSPHNADALMDQPTDDERSGREEAEEWLRSMLRDGPMLKRDVVKAYKAENIGSDVTLKRAARNVGVVSERDESQQGRPATWSLPGYGSPVTDQHPLTHNPQRSDQEQQHESYGYGSTSDPDPKPTGNGQEPPPDDLPDDLPDDPAERGEKQAEDAYRQHIGFDAAIRRGEQAAAEVLSLPLPKENQP